MGSDQFSDWEGIYYEFANANTRVRNIDSSSIEYVEMNPMTTSYSQIDGAVDEGYAKEGSFAGFMSDTGFPLDPTGAKCVVNMFRVTQDSEKTKADGSLVRIEAGHTMTGKVWDNKGEATNIEFTLQAAFYSLGGVGKLLAAVIGVALISTF